MVKGPTLLCIDCKSGRVLRWQNKKPVYFGAGVGFKLEAVGEAKLDMVQDIPLAALEDFRVSGTGGTCRP